MKVKITYLNTGKTETFEALEVVYTVEKICFLNERGFCFFYHDDKNVNIVISPK